MRTYKYHMMHFDLHLIALLASIGIYRPWERVVNIYCQRHFQQDLPKEICAACAITIFMTVSSIITLAVRQ